MVPISDDHVHFHDELLHKLYDPKHPVQEV